MTSVVLVAGGPLPDGVRERLIADAKAADAVIGIDGGARHLRALGLRPTYITGDCDSLTSEEREAWAAEGVALVPTPDQDYTDGDKALAFAFDTLHARQARIYAATGGRLDHLYSVLSMLVKYGRRGFDARLIDDVGETRYAAPRQTLSSATLPRRTLSLLAMGEVKGITLTGVRWPLDGDSLAPGVRDGTLNKIIAGTVTLNVGSGDLLVMLHHAAD